MNRLDSSRPVGTHSARGSRSVSVPSGLSERVFTGLGLGLKICIRHLKL